MTADRPSSVLGGADVIATEVEEVADLVVGGKEALHLAGRLPHRLEDGQRAEDVHLGAEQRIGPAHRHLQAGEMDDVRDLVFRQRVLEPAAEPARGPRRKKKRKSSR